MKILIAYYSKSGTARTCAELLGRELSNHKAELADLSLSFPDPAEFDAIVVGSSVRMGKLGKPFIKFVSESGNVLASKPHGFFVCGADSDSYSDYIRKAVDESLVDSAFEISYFGGELRPEKHKGLEKIMVKIMRDSYTDSSDTNDSESASALPTISEPTIAQFADKLKKSMLDRA